MKNNHLQPNQEWRENWIRSCKQPKAPMEIWINMYDNGEYYMHYSSASADVF